MEVSVLVHRFPHLRHPGESRLAWHRHHGPDVGVYEYCCESITPHCVYERMLVILHKLCVCITWSVNNRFCELESPDVGALLFSGTVWEWLPGLVFWEFLGGWQACGSKSVWEIHPGAALGHWNISARAVGEPCRYIWDDSHLPTSVFGFYQAQWKSKATTAHVGRGSHLPDQ